MLIELGARLGLDIAPADVRLHPRSDDAYQWSVLPDGQKLFRQNLSKLTSREYAKLMRGIGVIFEAVRREPDASNLSLQEDINLQQPLRLPAQMPGETFTSTIERLSSEVSALRQELSLLQRSAETESQARNILALEHQETRSAYITMREKYERSQDNARKLGIVAHTLQARVKDSNRGIQQLAILTRKLEEESRMALKSSYSETCESAE